MSGVSSVNRKRRVTEQCNCNRMESPLSFNVKLIPVMVARFIPTLPKSMVKTVINIPTQSRNCHIDLVTNSPSHHLFWTTKESSQPTCVRPFVCFEVRTLSVNFITTICVALVYLSIFSEIIQTAAAVVVTTIVVLQHAATKRTLAATAVSYWIQMGCHCLPRWWQGNICIHIHIRQKTWWSVVAYCTVHIWGREMIV